MAISFFIFAFLVFCIGETTYGLLPESHRVELFKRGVSTVPFEEDNGTIRERVVHSYRLPCLLDVGGVMVAVADARYFTSNDNSLIETVVKYSVDDGKTWKTQIAIKNSRVSSVSRVVDPTVLVKGNKLYVLVGSFNKTANYWTWHKDGSDWEPLLAVGEVTKSTVQGNTTADIKWEKPVSLNYLRSQIIAGSLLKEFLGGVSGAVVTSNGTFLIPVQVTNMAGQMYATMIRSDDEGRSWKFLEGLVGPGYSEPAVVEWEGKLIMSVRYDYNYRMVYESRDSGKSWTEALGTLSRVWGTSPRRNQPGSQASFIAVTIEEKRVMLFTHPLNTRGKWLRDKLHLWLTDGNRIHDVGQVSVGDENSAYSSLLYKDDKLYCLHEINSNEVYSLVFAELIGELKRIKRVIKAWKRIDDEIKKIRGPTDGLVGFLSGKSTPEKWADEYLCVSAMVENGTMVKNGFLFNGARSWAEWPVSRQGQNQRYYFANNVFTLVATVTISQILGDRGSLLGVVLDAYWDNYLELSYTGDQKWSVTYGPEEKIFSEKSWVKNKEYQVALTLFHGELSVFIDGELLQGSTQRIPSLHMGSGISHFYFGAPGADATCVTVANVFLYNRMLGSSQLNALMRVKGTILDVDNEGDIMEFFNDSFKAKKLKSMMPFPMRLKVQREKKKGPRAGKVFTQESDDDDDTQEDFFSLDEQFFGGGGSGSDADGEVKQAGWDPFGTDFAHENSSSWNELSGSVGDVNSSKIFGSLMQMNNKSDNSLRPKVFCLVCIFLGLFWFNLFC